MNEEIFCLHPEIDREVVENLDNLSGKGLCGAERIALKQFDNSVIAVLIC